MHCDTTPSGQLRLINFFKPILFMASDSSSGFRRGISHFFTATKGIQLREWKEEQTNNMNLGQFQAQEREFCVTIFCSFSCICKQMWACIFRKTSTKATKNANSSLTVFLHCLLLLTVLSRDCYLSPTVLLCSPLSSALSGFLFSTDPLSSLGPLSPFLRPLSPFVWVSRQNRQGDRLPGAHTHIVSQHLSGR